MTDQATIDTATSDAPDTTALGDMAGFMIRVVQVQLFEAFYARFGDRGLTTGSFTALVAIRDNPGIRQGVLARTMMVKRSNMTKLIQSMERAGLVARRTPSDDRRSIELELTKSGRRLIDAVFDEAIDHDRETTAALSVRERKVLMGLLGKLSDHLRLRAQIGE
jgi:DNA-binding MarR family transcriptional regulator